MVLASRYYESCNNILIFNHVITLGYGFLEKVYEKAMMIEFRKANVPAVSQDPIKVLYEDEIIGEYFADILVDRKVIVEIKATKNLIIDHEAQLLNYLKATDIEVGLLLNFGAISEILKNQNAGKSSI